LSQYETPEKVINERASEYEISVAFPFSAYVYDLTLTHFQQKGPKTMIHIFFYSIWLVCETCKAVIYFMVLYQMYWQI
jgi:hypothetical protein